VRPVGSGGLTDVYLYERESREEEVAVKVLRADVLLSEQELAAFHAAARAMTRLGDHPCIVSVTSAGTTSAEEGSMPYLLLAYCPPPDLGARVRTRPLSVPEAVRTGIQLAGALETAHRSGIVHRDIKPSNILITASDEPALTDFGISGWRHEPESGPVGRTPRPWTPPELLDGRSDGAIASDVYSLGATIWTLVVGRSPFSIPAGDDSAGALSARILHSYPPRLPLPEVPPELDQLLALCLAKNPAERPGTALELARALQRIETGSGFTLTPLAVEDDGRDQADLPPPVTVASAQTAAERPAGPAREAHPAEPRPRVSATLGWTVAAVVLVVLVGVLVWRAASSGDPSAAPPGVIPPTSHSTAAPGVVPRPRVTARRAGDHVAYRWRPSDTPQPGESYEWRVSGRGDGSHLTNGTATTVTAAGRVCLQVRLLRAGLPPSAWASACA
jgi:serine/threonine protein kinase